MLRCRSAGCVDPLLGVEQPHRDELLHRVGGVVEEERELPALARGEVAQDEVGGIHPARRAADADPHAVVVPRPPPPFSRRGPARGPTSWWTTTSRSTGTEKNRSNDETGPPESFMYPDGTAITAAGPGTPPGPIPRRTWAACARALWERSADPVRRASSSTTMAPTLWRLLA